MFVTDKTASGLSINAVDGELSPGIDSRFRLIVVAALRSKQLLHGSHPRIEADPKRRRNTSIALEEVRRGLVPFVLTGEVKKSNGGSAELISGEA